MQALISELIQYLPTIVLLYFLLKFLYPEDRTNLSQILEFKNDFITLRLANSLCAKKVGLLNHSQLAPNCGLLLMGIRSIHTYGMAFDIDVLCVDKNWRVLQLDNNVSKGNVIRGPSQTQAIIELAAGVAKKNSIEVGQVLSIKNGNTHERA